MKKTTTVLDILQSLETFETHPTFTGHKTFDANFPTNFILVESPEVIYSFNSNDVLGEEKLEDGRVKVKMRNGAVGSVTRPFRLGEPNVGILTVTEHAAPPKPVYRKGDPVMATKKDVEEIKKNQPKARTLASVAANWSGTGSCILADSEGETNCAHFLSDAFIRAGYGELVKSAKNPHFKEWCDFNDTKKSPEARPVRAKEMWAWFQSMATVTERKMPSKKGLWAVFQWDKSYSGGHVLLYDSDKGKFYGTGAYWNWTDQFFYQW